LGIEIERKFIVANDEWKADVERSTVFRQGYITPGPPAAVRVRIEGEQANLNVKQSVLDIERLEFEYSIPLEDAHDLLDSVCQGRIVTKTRHIVKVDQHVWEIDVFEELNEGLVVAEIELETREETFKIPNWVGQEVSGDARYLNSSLSKIPFCEW
jgi:adenylate cyclase